MKILQKPLPPTCYFGGPRCPTIPNAPPIPREGIVLHFTAGTTANSAWMTFVNDSKPKPVGLGQSISVPFIIDSDPDGTVWQCYDPRFWGYQLAEDPNPAWEYWRNDRRLVGLEIASIGPLELGHDMKTLTWLGTKIVYGQLDDPNLKVMRLDQPFRGAQFFVPFTDAQVRSTVELCVDLCDRYELPRVIPPAAKRFEADLGYYAHFKGVCSHVNFRKAWTKWDMAPGHSDAIWAGLLATGFTEATS